ncbi:MAG: acyl-CoA dehydratase activase [Pseudomonadota bacterium]
MRFFGGVDVGASATKAVVVDDLGGILGEAVRRTGVDIPGGAGGCLDDALAAAGHGRDDLAALFATGFGRHEVPFAMGTKTEIGCHARGCFHHFPQAITIIDIGGQDAKVIRLDARGATIDFKMNRKCAAGTGAFLEEIAERLEVPLDRVNQRATASTETVSLGSYCTVFTKTEILAKMREGKPLDALLRGVLESVVKRVLEMCMPEGDVVMSGGVVAHHPLVVTLLGERLGRPVLLPPSPQTIGALGAALLAKDAWQRTSGA